VFSSLKLILKGLNLLKYNIKEGENPVNIFKKFLT